MLTAVVVCLHPALRSIRLLALPMVGQYATANSCH